MKCQFCGASIKADTDDNYNIDHTRINCPECGNWSAVTDHGLNPDYPEHRPLHESEG